MRRWMLLLLVAFATLGSIAILFTGCGGDDDDDDDDDDDCQAEEIGGTYQVTEITEEDSCDEENVGNMFDGLIIIEQEGADTSAAIYWQDIGPGSEKRLIFTGTICGTNVIGTRYEELPQGDYDCYLSKTFTYSLVVNLANGELSGQYTADILWAGEQCEEAVGNPENCHWNIEVVPRY